MQCKDIVIHESKVYVEDVQFSGDFTKILWAAFFKNSSKNDPVVQQFFL